MAANQKLILEKELIVIDSSSDSEADNKDEDEKKEVGSEHVYKTKSEEYKMLADLSSFPGLAAMLAAEANMRRKSRRRNQIRRMKRKLTKVDGGEGRNNDLGRNQLVPSESGTVQMLSADDTKKEKLVKNCEPVDKTVSESSCDGLQTPIESRPRLSSSSGEKMTGDDCCCSFDMDVVAKEVFVGEERSNKEQDDAADDTEKEKTVSHCEPADKTVSGSSCDGLHHPIESGPRLSSTGEKMNGNDCCCRVEMESVATELVLGEEKSNEEQDDEVCRKGKEKLIDSCRDTDKRILDETESVDRKHNMVLQKLLRPLRYFSPPESRWMCGEGNHIAARCSKQKRKKACFICADFGHEWRQCRKVNICFICDRRGHLAKDCPQKDVAQDLHSKSCLKCGDSGHDMFSCDNMYSFDDLKKIQCYVCKDFGHICCYDYAAGDQRQVSCYTCGKSGHGGYECTGFHKNANSLQSAASCNNHEERGRVVQQRQYMKGGEQGSLSTLKKSAGEQGSSSTLKKIAGGQGNLSMLKRCGRQRDGTLSVNSAPHKFIAWESNQIAQKQTVYMTHGWPRRNNVWVRVQTQPHV